MKRFFSYNYNDSRNYSETDKKILWIYYVYIYYAKDNRSIMIRQQICQQIYISMKF